LPWSGHEQVVWSSDRSTGYRGIIAIHNTALGPAIGGTRLWHYPDGEAALADALRLSRAMTWKAALAGLPVGGGKSVIIHPPGEFDREALFLSHGRAVQSLAGRYLAAEDVGTRVSDMAAVGRMTRWVVGLPDRSGDPSPMTALGVHAAMSAGARWLWGSESLAGRRVAIQGCGGVGSALARLVAGSGATVVVADTDPTRAAALADELGLEVEAPDRILERDCDIFAPCALGGVLHSASIDRLRATLVVGGANNQLVAEEDSAALAQRGVLYLPDFLANAGGLITGYGELKARPADETRTRVLAIGDTTTRVLQSAASSGITPQRAAIDIARARLRTLGRWRYSLH